MSEEQKKKGERLSMILSIADLALLAVCMIVMGINHMVESLIFPITIGALLLVYWLIADVLNIKLTDGFAGKTDFQKKAYYQYALIDLAGLAGLMYYLVDMNSTTGALIFVACLFLKRRFHEEFKNDPSADTSDDEPEQIAEDANDGDRQ